jgi:hypothetical protein
MAAGVLPGPARITAAGLRVGRSGLLPDFGSGGR